MRFRSSGPDNLSWQLPCMPLIPAAGAAARRGRAGRAQSESTLVGHRSPAAAAREEERQRAPGFPADLPRSLEGPSDGRRRSSGGFSFVSFSIFPSNFSVSGAAENGGTLFLPYLGEVAALQRVEACSIVTCISWEA